MVDGHALNGLAGMGSNLVQTDPDVADGPALVVTATHVALSVAEHLVKVVHRLLRGGVLGLLVFLFQATVTSPHDLVVDMDLADAPLEGRDAHDQSSLDIPLSRAEEAEEERVGVVGLGHVPERHAQLLGGVGGQGLLVLLGEAKLVVGLLGRTVVLFDTAKPATLHGLLLALRGAGDLADGAAILGDAGDLGQGNPQLLELGLLVVGQAEIVAGVCEFGGGSHGVGLFGVEVVFEDGLTDVGVAVVVMVQGQGAEDGGGEGEGPEGEGSVSGGVLGKGKGLSRGF